jgi:hypothetical protein
MLKKKLFALSVATIFCNSNAFADSDAGQYPNISGKTLFEFRGDRVTSTNKNDVDANNGKINIDADFALNFTKNWSLATSWRFRPVDDDGRQTNPERYRTILSTNRGINLNDEGLIVEQLKGQYENEDFRAFFGKFNPAFGSAYRKEKRIGVFTTDFTKDYELREKIGGGITAILEDSEVTVDAFFNDTTGLSNSAINARGKESRSDGLAGNTSNPSSYTVSIEGQDLFGVKNLFYNAGYRHLKVDNLAFRSDETGMVGGLEYLIPVSFKTSLIPFVEVASIKNLSGLQGRDALYTTTALVGKYSGWTSSIAYLTRHIDQFLVIDKQKDHLMQYSVGYKFSNNIAVDVSKARVTEANSSGSLIGLLVSYSYNF